MSAAKREGTHEVICLAYELWHKNKEDKEEYGGYRLFYMFSTIFCHSIIYTQ
jgi:hypothetical protein